MSTLTEAEVYDQLQTAIGEARDACKNLSVRSEKGRSYSSLRDNLELIEGCCRQMSAFRADYRWLPIGIKIAQCHSAAGGWLRGYYDHGVHVKWEPGHVNKMFVTLEQVLAGLSVMADQFRSRKTGVLGPILPASMTMQAPRKEGTVAPPSKPKLILPPRYRKAS